jgi:hypothetical protein
MKTFFQRLKVKLCQGAPPQPTPCGGNITNIEYRDVLLFTSMEVFFREKSIVVDKKAKPFELNRRALL